MSENTISNIKIGEKVYAINDSSKVSQESFNELMSISNENKSSIELANDKLDELLNKVLNSGSSMEIYKCAAVHEASAGEVSGYLISGSSIDYLNGTYVFYTSYENQDQTSFVYRNESGSDLYLYPENFQWMAPYIMKPNPDNSDLPEYQMPVCQAVLQGSETKLSDVTRWENLDGDTFSFTLQELVTPGTSAEWDGYKYNTKAKEFSKELTEGLSFGKTTPTVGNCYNADVSMYIKFLNKDGLLFWLKCESATDFDDTGMSQMTYSSVTFEEVGGRKAMHCRVGGGAVGVAKTVNFPVGDSPFTVCGWLYMVNALNYAGGFGFGTDPTNSAMYHQVGSAMFCYDAGTAGRQSYSTYNYEYNTWVFVCYTYDGNGKYRLYYDGTEVKTTDATANLLATPEFKIHTTYETPNVNNPNIYYSDIRLYGRCLSADEIQDIYYGND